MMPYWEFVLLRFREDSTWDAIGKLIISVGVLVGWKVSSATVAELAVAGGSAAFVVAIFCPALGSPVTTDVGAAKIAAGIPLASSQSAPAGTAPAAPRIPVPTIGETS